MKKWKAYLRADGSKGIRNRLLVIYTVLCARHAAERIVSAFDGWAELVGFDGCTDNAYAQRVLEALCSHPNVGAVLAVGLGCEYLQPSRFAAVAEESGRPARWLSIQEEGGTLPAVLQGRQYAGKLLKVLTKTPLCEMGPEELVIGAECGGSDATSGLAGNLVTGALFDRLGDMGARVVFEEIVEAIGLREQLCSRAADAGASAALSHTYDKALDYCRSVGQFSVSPGNFAGGLSSIEEKSMGAVVKSGTRPIQGVLKVTQRPPRSGLWLLDTTPDPNSVQYGITNPNDNEGLTALAASGCHISLLVTGRGNVIGNAVTPIIKVTGNSNTFLRMSGDMDFDASPILRNELMPEEMTDKLFELVCATASGQQVKAELTGHREWYIPYKYQNLTCREQKE